MFNHLDFTNQGTYQGTYKKIYASALLCQHDYFGHFLDIFRQLWDMWDTLKKKGAIAGRILQTQIVI